MWQSMPTDQYFFTERKKKSFFNQKTKIWTSDRLCMGATVHWRANEWWGECLGLWSSGNSPPLQMGPGDFNERVFQSSLKAGFEFHLVKCIFQFLWGDIWGAYSSALALNSSLCGSSICNCQRVSPAIAHVTGSGKTQAGLWHEPSTLSQHP